MIDKVYDSAELREDLKERGAEPGIPDRSNRSQLSSSNKKLHQKHYGIENAFSRLKDFSASPPL